MAEAVVRILLGKITDSGYKEALLLYGVGDKVEWAKRELEWVSAFLTDSDAKQNKSASVKQWVKDVQEVAYMIEDALDKFLVEMGGGRSNGILRRICHVPNALIARHKVGTEIEKIKQRLLVIKDNITIFGLMSLESSSGCSSTRQPIRPIIVPEIDKTDVVGFQDDIKNICKQLLDQSVWRRSVISIVGAGGRGKTTLATKIYKSSLVERHFDTRIWLTISQEFKIIDVLKKILRKLSGKDAKKVAGDEEDSVTEIHKLLTWKRYLIVLDDVWSSDLWTQLEVALPENRNGSRVLITTRFINIAKESDAANKPYELRILSEDESQQLLLKKIFPNQPANTCPDNLLPLINKFVQKCGGWPLALVVLGGILSTKDVDYYAWDKIMLKMNWRIEGSECLDIVSTSYDDLPIHLKSCFMYIASFPEDHKIKAAALIQLWISEGLILHDSTETLEETAENYLEELVQRTMVQVSKKSWSGKIKDCYVHDILRELAIRKAKENNFLLVCSNFDANSTSETSALTRRIAFHEYGYLPIRSVSQNLRSLIYFGKYLPNYNEPSMVRVLHLEYGEYHRDDFQWLKHLTSLRYFRYKGGRSSTTPTSFWNNKMLRYVKIEGFFNFVMGPPSSVNLENLVTLKGVIARGEWTVKLPYFPRIRKLGVFIDSDIDWEALTNSMSKLEHLYSLSIFTWTDTPSRHPCLISAFKNYKKMHSLHLVCRWPRDVISESSFFPPHLVKLTLTYAFLKQDPMPELEKLANLRVLRLLNYSYEGERLNCSVGGLRCLKQLKLQNLVYLKELIVEKGTMPMLNLLEIRSCRNLKILPDLHYLTNLQELKVRSTSDEFCSKLKGADQHKVKHIQSIIFEED